MPKYDEFTPCPAPAPWVGPRALPNSYRLPETDFTFTSREIGGRNGSTTQFADGDTEDLDFTTELGATLRNAAPRRRKTAARKTGAWKPELDIHEDESEQHQESVSRRTLTLPTVPAPSLPRQGPSGTRRSSILPPLQGQDQPRRGTILAQPAHRLPSVPEATRPTRRRVSAILAERQSNTEERMARVADNHDDEAPKLKKNPRRRTIYVPSDDTTIMTIHPGASFKATNPAPQADDGIHFDIPSYQKELNERAAAPQTRASRKSLAAAPKRVPMQASTRALQGSISAPAIAGKGGGKENIPPGMAAAGKTKKASIVITISDSDQPKASHTSREGTSRSSNPSTKALAPKTESRKRTTSDLAQLGDRPKQFRGEETQANANSDAVQTMKRTDAPVRHDQCSPISESAGFHGMKSSGASDRVPSKLSVPLIELAQEQQKRYPVLLDDIIRPQMYEDNWLSYQESAITQLLNALFDSASTEKPLSSHSDHRQLRKGLLHLYHEPPFPLLHKRLQASLMYGALSIPQENLASSLRLKDDVGQRRRFLNVWLESYDYAALKATAEVVIGRELTESCIASRQSQPDQEGHRTRAEMKALEAFLETFLVRNDDATRMTNSVASIGSIARGNILGSVSSGDDADFGGRGWSWRRTVHRSLMLVLLLDKGKTQGIIQGCLFRSTSQNKSTISVLRTLSNLILPSLGDISRALGHLNYNVSYTQLPIQEYQHRVDNLATDMRDGVRLTRLVELLVYPTSSQPRQQDITVVLPAGELLVTPGGHSEPSTLSHHLKLPATGRAQKAYNVQVALSALEGVTKGASAWGLVTADDVVNGHREKTVGLLWGLVSKWGLGYLLDWDELAREVARLQSRYQPGPEHGITTAGSLFDGSEASQDEGELNRLAGLERYTFLLKAWASVIAKSHGLTVSNLSTSFADGRVFESIVDEYAGYFPAASTSGTRASLEAQLKKLGCSSYFGKS